MSRRTRSIARRSRTRHHDDPPLDPMVDIVFLLLVFFLFNFELQVLEEDRLFATPELSAVPSQQTTPPPLVELAGDESGALASITIGGESFDSVDAFQTALADLTTTDESGSAGKVLLRADPIIKYEEVVQVGLIIRRAGRQVVFLPVRPSGEQDASAQEGEEDVGP